jgi:hypothetical protein
MEGSRSNAAAPVSTPSRNCFEDRAEGTRMIYFESSKLMQRTFIHKKKKNCILILYRLRLTASKSRIKHQSMYTRINQAAYPRCILSCFSRAKISGCLWTLGMRPSPIALRMAFAIFRWLTGRNPVSEECLIRPISVMYSDMMEKF